MFGENGDNAAKNSTAVFSAPGAYALQLTVADPANQQVASNVNVNVTYLKGDLTGDGKRTISDVLSLMMALADLSGYQSHRDLSNTALLQIADTDGDGFVTNHDVQGLISLIASDAGNSGSGGGSASFTAASETSNQSTTTVLGVNDQAVNEAGADPSTLNFNISSPDSAAFSPLRTTQHTSVADQPRRFAVTFARN